MAGQRGVDGMLQKVMFGSVWIMSRLSNREGLVWRILGVTQLDADGKLSAVPGYWK